MKVRLLNIGFAIMTILYILLNFYVDFDFIISFNLIAIGFFSFVLSLPLKNKNANIL